MGAHRGYLGRDEGSPGTSSAIAQSSGCGRAVRSDGGDNFSSDESELLHNNNPKEGRE
jgi:hypothetical protein